MILKSKNIFWKLTFPFAHNNYTTIGETLFYPKGYPPIRSIILHEEVHAKQQKEVGIVKFIFLYLFAFPFLWNPWSFKWEYEAYRKGSKYDKHITLLMLKCYKYGWLRWNRANPE